MYLPLGHMQQHIYSPYWKLFASLAVTVVTFVRSNLKHVRNFISQLSGKINLLQNPVFSPLLHSV